MGNPAGSGIRLTQGQATAIGKKIWQNECGGTVAGLTSWNSGEAFASLGIGHFIWYPAGKPGPFEESFPKLLIFMQQRGVTPPAWAAGGRACPWSTRAQFESDRNSARMQELRAFLAGTIPQQTEFIVLRLETALPKMLGALPSGSEQDRVRRRFFAVAETPQGIYALIDYVNFKGEGVSPAERYGGQGWGLLQVLQEMRGDPAGAAAASEFGAASKRVLQRRVANAPPARNEARWLQGWMNRCDTYGRTF